MRTSRLTLIFIGIVQIACGAVFLASAAAITALFGVQLGAPAWVNCTRQRCQRSWCGSSPSSGRVGRPIRGVQTAALDKSSVGALAGCC
jgi:hypothetical protein